MLAPSPAWSVNQKSCQSGIPARSKTVEFRFNRMKHFCGIATRQDKHLYNYLAVVNLICTSIWCGA
jgi:transposase